MPIEEIRAKTRRWINITDAKDINGPEIRYLKKNFNFHSINLEDCISVGQRPKIDTYKDSFFVVLLYPIYNRRTGEIIPAEIDFFVGRGYIITIHDNKLQTIVRYFNHLKKQKNQREMTEYLSNNVIIMLYEQLSRLLGHCFPMLDHISVDIHKAEKNIFQRKEKELVEQILVSRRNIVNFRKSMSAHKNILKKLQNANRGLNLFDPKKADIYYNSLIDKSKDIWDSLDSFKESIEALHDTNESLISFRLNQIMKNFTVISVIIFVLTLVATILGLDAHATPFINWPFAFWIIVLIEILVALIVFKFFKRKKWLE